MKVAEAPDQPGQKPMGFFVRPMRMEDIVQVVRVERECFPTGWAPTPFVRELRNRRAAYLVACATADPSQSESEARAFAARERSRQPPSLLQRLVTGVRDRLVGPALPPPDFSQTIVGFVGVWFMGDESHITAIGVREQDRRHGVGELLLLASIELSLPQRSRLMTLELRVSNRGAQALYEKYGFNPAGVRKRYYADNREDALIMTTDEIAAPEYQGRLERLRQAHTRRWGPSVRFLG